MSDFLLSTTTCCSQAKWFSASLSHSAVADSKCASSLPRTDSRLSDAVMAAGGASAVESRGAPVFQKVFVARWHQPSSSAGHEEKTSSWGYLYL